MSPWGWFCHRSPSNLPSLTTCFCLPAERHLVRAVLLRRIQSDEPHVVHRLWSTGPGKPIRHLAHHAEHDRRSYLLCRFYWPRNSSDPVLGLLQAAVSGKGEERHHLCPKFEFPTSSFTPLVSFKGICSLALIF